MAEMVKAFAGWQKKSGLLRQKKLSGAEGGLVHFWPKRPSTEDPDKLHRHQTPVLDDASGATLRLASPLVSKARRGPGTRLATAATVRAAAMQQHFNRHTTHPPRDKTRPTCCGDLDFLATFPDYI